jgi:class 3 adenylate cyclase
VPEQRRLVTVVFADVVGSTALAEELDAEDVRALFTRYYALANEVVTSHGGIVAKLLGDGVLACFGVPTAHGDDAQRALDAALTLRDGVARDVALQRLQLRIGVNTGEVLANEDASGEIVGDAVNVAARVAAAAGEGEVLAADATHRAAAAIAYGDPREIAAKGKSQPVRVWPVTGHARAHESSTTPFIGREDDLAQLDLVAKRAFRDRRPYLVTVTAPPGTGKSRLAHAFRERLPENARYAHAHCPPYGEMLAYGPLRELLVDLVDVSPDAPPEDVRRQVGAVLDGPAAQRDAMLVGLTVAPEASPSDQDREQVVGAWRRLIERIASERPLLIVLEDLQNASDSLIDLVEQLAQPTLAAPLVLLCLARPELLQRRPTWGGGRRNTVNLALDPLPDGDIASLVERLLEAQPPAQLRDLIVERAAGNPFFAEELVRALLERGPVDLSDPAAVTHALRSLPETVQATLLARIDMLPAHQRALLQAASVVGRTFAAETLHAVGDAEPTEIATALEGLIEREFVARTSEGEYAFRNALIRDVAYGMLPRAKRARDHARIAQHLETTAGDRADERAGRIGLHYLEATRLRRMSAVPDGDAAGAESARAGAIQWLARSARANVAASAWQEAIAQLADAVTIATDDEKSALLLQLGEAALGGDIGWDAFVEALARWRATDERDPAMGSRIIVGMLGALFRSGVSITPSKLPGPEEQERLAREALDLARQSGNELAVASAQVIHGYLERTRGGRTRASLEAARDATAQAAAVLERRGHIRLWSYALDAQAALLGDLGDLAGGYRVALRRIARQDELPGTERAHANWTIPIYATALGDFERARTHVQVALDEPSLMSAHWAAQAVVGELFLISWRAATNWALGEWDLTIADARRALADIIPKLPVPSMKELFRDVGDAALYAARRREDHALAQGFVPLLRAWCDDERSKALMADDPTQLDAALEHVETAGIDLWQAERSLSLLAAYGRVPVGAPRLDALVAWAEPRGLRPLLAQVLRLRARLNRSTADARRAHALLVECGMVADAALAGVELAALGDRSQLAAAREELERLGDRRGLAAVEALG